MNEMKMLNFTERLKKHTLMPLLVLVLSLVAIGCGKSGPETHHVQGKIAIAGGDVSSLAGSYIEAIQDENEKIRSFGEIQPDGSFALQTYYQGENRDGVLEGNYRVRVVIGDDDPTLSRQANKLVPKRYREFKNTDLAFKAPSSEAVVLEIKQR